MAFYFYSTKYLEQNKILKNIREKTTIKKKKDVLLICELFIFLMKLKILTTGYLLINCFGQFYTHEFKRTQKFKRRNVFKKIRLKSSRKKLTMMINNLKKIEYFNYNQQHSDLEDIYRQVAKIFYIRLPKVVLLFRIFIYSLIEEILEHNNVTIKHFGKFIVKEVNYKKTNICGREKKIILKKRLFFIMSTSFFKELNKQSTEIYVNSKLKKLLDANKISTKIII